MLGVDLAVDLSGPDRQRPAPRRTPVRGGAVRDLSLQQGGSARVTFLASGKAGWAAICRMVSATHLAGERGRPVATPDLLAPAPGRR